MTLYLKTGKLKILSYFLVSTLFLTLTACTTNRFPQYKGGPTKRDGAPREHADVSGIPDAQPKMEPRSKYGNPRSYKIKGKRYHVMKTAKGYNKVGIASWYGTRFHGRLTSSRERYNLYGMTAAHPFLPIPSYVKVTNLANGRTVVVKVNDRGPFHRSGRRILDLSYAAAKKLDFAHRGTAKVRVTAIDPAKFKHSHFASANVKQKRIKSVNVQNKQLVLKRNTQSLSGKELVHLQVGAFSKRINAEQLKTRLLNLIQQPIKINRDTHSRSPLYRVHIVSSRDEFDRLQELLQKHGLMPLVNTTG